MRLHKANRRATYMPNQQCPAPMDKLEDDRGTITHKHDGTTEDFVEQLHSLDNSKHKRKLNTAWKGEAWFKVKQNTRPPKPPIPIQYTEKQERPDEMATSNGQQPSSAQPPQSATGIPRPKEVPATDDYWIGEGHLCKSPHKARTELYLSPQTQDGPDVTKLNPERPTMVRPTREQDGTR